MLFHIQRIDAVTLNIRSGLGYQVTKMMLCDDIHHETMFDDLDIFLGSDRLQQGSLHFSPRNIFMMQNAEFRMTALPSPFKLTFFILIEPCSPFDHFLDTLGSFLYNDLHDFRIAQPVTGN